MIRHVTRLHGVTHIRPLAALLSGFVLVAAFLVSSSVAAAGYTGTADSANARFVVDKYSQCMAFVHIRKRRA